MAHDALIGSTGFVGTLLTRQHRFGATFNRANIDSLPGASFDTVVCAAAPGSMVTANQDPDGDRRAIDQLTTRLGEVQARHFVLISSIAVLADFAGGDTEDTQAFQQDLAYGRNRRALEAFCEDRFDECLVVRLPALFGQGLRKNFLFDLMNPVPSMLPEALLQPLADQFEPHLRAVLMRLYASDNATGMLKLDRPSLDADPHRAALDGAVREAGMSATQFHHPCNDYQYYDMDRLWADICVSRRAGLKHIHLAVAPLRAANIHASLTGAPMPDTNAKLHREDMHTRHAALWNREGPYLEDAETVMTKLQAFFKRQKGES